MNAPTAGLAKPKGPIVWLVYAPNRDQLTKRRAANSAAARARVGEPLPLAYGPTPIEALDVYRPFAGNPATSAGAAVGIFVHGGAWRSCSAAEFTFLAEPFVRAGANFAVLDFMNVEDAGGDLSSIVEQVRRAVGWVYRNAEKFGGDRDRLYLISHSSGSHLAGCVVTHDWASEGLPRDILKGATLSSGMYDRCGYRSARNTLPSPTQRSMRFPPSGTSTSSRPRSFSVTDSGIPAADARFCRRDHGCRQAGRASGRGSLLQPFRNAGDAGQSLRLARPRGAPADGLDMKTDSVGQAAAASAFGILRIEVRISSAPQRPQA
jgi:hypothetical protein